MPQHVLEKDQSYSATSEISHVRITSELLITKNKLSFFGLLVMFRGRRRKGTRAVVILQGTTASHHGDQEAGKEDHEEDHDLRSLADFHGAKAS